MEDKSKMRVTYSNRSEAIETVYTYEEWLKEYNHRKTKRRIRQAKRRAGQRIKYLYYMKQRISGTIMTAIGIVTIFVPDRDVTFSLVALFLGIFLLTTQKKIMKFQTEVFKNMTKREIIKNAVSAVIRDGYDQVVYRNEDKEYTFSRDYPLNNMYNPENVIGHVVTGWKAGIFNAEFITCQ